MEIFTDGGIIIEASWVDWMELESNHLKSVTTFPVYNQFKFVEESKHYSAYQPMGRCDILINYLE